jgi:methylmalonyl-CoA epimerase
MIQEVRHIGIAVYSIDKTLEEWSNNFGAVEVRRIAFPEMGQISSVIKVGNMQFELMEPLGEDGVVKKYLDQRGEGLHHVSLRSDDLETDCDKMEDNGIRLLGRSAADRTKTVFTHPKTTAGIVFEITDKEA